MAQRRWFHMSRSTFAAARPAVEALHRAHGLARELPVLWNADGSACLVCVDGATKEWRALQPWMAACFGVYARDNYPGAPRLLDRPVRRPAAVEAAAEELAEDDLWDD